MVMSDREKKRAQRDRERQAGMCRYEVKCLDTKSDKRIIRWFCNWLTTNHLTLEQLKKKLIEK